MANKINKYGKREHDEGREEHVQEYSKLDVSNSRLSELLSAGVCSQLKPSREVDATFQERASVLRDQLDSIGNSCSKPI